MSILANTKKSSVLDRKNSAKLPKLSIQQQIDNNEVIERMNRKITFTKNQRHLTKTLQYVQALQTTSQGSIFRVEPKQLYYTNFQVNKIYESEIKLVNRSKHIQRIKITPLQRKQFVVSNVQYPIEDSGDIAPGMQVSIFVRFKPNNLHDIEDQLIIIIADGVIKVPILGQREKCKGQWPAEINCGHCWVGDQQLRQINIPNSGGQALYRLENSGGDQSKQIGVFKIWPTEIMLEKNKKNLIKVQFRPLTQGLFEEKVSFVSNQGDEEKIVIKLKGGAYSASISLDEINQQKVSVKKYHNFLYLNDCEPGKQSVSNFKVHNHAVVPVDFLWFYENQPNFAIEKQKGKIQPSQILNFIVKFKPTSRIPKNIVASLYLFNLPKESISNDAVPKLINGLQMIQCLKVEIRASSKDSDIDVIPLHKRIGEKLYKGQPKRTSFIIQNNSSVNRSFWVTKVHEDPDCRSNCEIEGQKILKANSSQEIWFNFSIDELSKNKKAAYYLVNFDNLQSKIISIDGEVQFPSLQVSSSQISFELLRVNSIYKKQFKIMNTGENPVQFKFTNSHRYYHLDFYDFYQFEDDSFYQDKLKILYLGGQECSGWRVIGAKSQQILQFQINTKQQMQFSLAIELLVMNGEKHDLLVTGEIQNVYAKLSQNLIQLKQLFQGNIYNSNKFLPRQLSVENLGNVEFSYEIFAPQIQQCLITVSPLHGKVQGKKKRRIDLVMEPLKTGLFSPEFQIHFYDDIPLHPLNYTDLDSIIEVVPEDRRKLIKTEHLKIEGKIRGVQTSYYLKDDSKAKKVVQKFVDEGHGSVKMSNYSYKSATASKTHYLQSYKIVYPPLQQLNFYNCEINKVQQQQIIIENNSELTTEFQIFAENFRSIEKANSTRSLNKGMMNTQEIAFTSDLGKTYLENRALNQAQKIYLSNNKGISIMCEPSSGILHKKQSQKIIITMFNDTSGKFKDELVISVKDHQVKKFPINLQIKGTPVSLSRNQIGINFNNQTPILSAGTFLKGDGKSTRNIKICNNGPKEVQIKWVLYPYGSAEQNSNFFNISFINSEPGTGNIVETNWQAIKPAPLKNPPFSISPAERILKGRQQLNFLLTIQESKVSKKIQVLAIGIPTIVSEKEKVVMQQLAIIVEAEIVSPKLKVDQKHANHINKFERFADHGQQYRTKGKDYHRKLKLKNNQRCNINFTVQVLSKNTDHQSFQIVSTTTDSPLNKLKQKNLNPTTNTKNKSFALPEIDKQFTLPYQSFVEIGIDFKANIKNAQQWPLEQKIRKDGQLLIHFSNGDTQTIPLVGWLYRPFLNILMPNNSLHSHQNFLIEFGVVHVNNHKKKSIYLANPTKSAANWTISYVKYQQSKKIIFQKQLWTALDYEDQTITDQKKCFKLSSDSGQLLAESIPIHKMPGTLALYSNDDKYAQTHKPFKLDFVFKPQSNVLYKSKFIIKVDHGPTYEIVLRGKGTFQQEAQIK